MESSELLSNFLKIYDLKEYKVIPTGLNGIEPLKNSIVKFIKPIMII